MTSNAERKRMRKMEKWAGIKHDSDGERINPLTASWHFTAWYEKIILFVLMILGFWKFAELIF